jgi:colicin import membrane protein
MRGLTLQRAATLSMVLHVALFFLAAAVAKKSATILPQRVYKVTIISPEAKRVAKATVPKRRRIPPPKKAVKPKKEMPQAKKANTVPAEYVSERVSSIKQTRDNEQYKSERLEAIERKRRLQSISHAAVSQAEEAEGTPSKTRADGVQRQEIQDRYTARVQASIYEVWVYPDIDIKGLKAVISVKILENGTIVVNKFESPSGNRLFDRSALKAISKASPVEPPPFGSSLYDVLLNFYPDVED